MLPRWHHFLWTECDVETARPLEERMRSTQWGDLAGLGGPTLAKIEIIFRIFLASGTRMCRNCGFEHSFEF
jgi:hypothetical protein